MAKVCQSRLVAAGEVFSSLTRPQHWQLCDTVTTYSQSEVCVSWCYCEKAGIEAFLLFIYIYIFLFATVCLYSGLPVSFGIPV